MLARCQPGQSAVPKPVLPKPGKRTRKSCRRETAEQLGFTDHLTRPLRIPTLSASHLQSRCPLSTALSRPCRRRRRSPFLPLSSPSWSLPSPPTRIRTSLQLQHPLATPSLAKAVGSGSSSSRFASPASCRRWISLPFPRRSPLVSLCVLSSHAQADPCTYSGRRPPF